MNKNTKRIIHAKISELISVFVVIPLILLVQSNANINVSVFVAPPQDPIITEIISHPNLNALTIKGESIYNTETVQIEDQIQRQAVEVVTDVEGNFTAVIDGSSKLTWEGPHKIVAYIHIKQDQVIVLESDEVLFDIDEKFNVVFDSANTKDVLLSVNKITTEEIEILQTQNDFSILPHAHYEAFKGYVSSYRNLSQLYQSYQLVIYLLILFFFLFAMTRRVKRKKANGQSFWSLGKGIYFPQERKF